VDATCNNTQPQHAPNATATRYYNSSAKSPNYRMYYLLFFKVYPTVVVQLGHAIETLRLSKIKIAKKEK